MTKQGKFPVIYLTFKDEKYSTWEDCKEGIELLIRELYMSHEYLIEGNTFNEYQKKSGDGKIPRCH